MTASTTFSPSTQCQKKRKSMTGTKHAGYDDLDDFPLPTSSEKAVVPLQKLLQPIFNCHHC
ncbi:hypothetical protein N7495_008988 [Penicillium taxi]|uniref:uncharacterized protein n=1 Tax=Penicillium taxi TaxID=168475 RepID=UPI002545AAA0|nr:uncharacterized protein N7495_008988 [Penicillium taxi]KAJ5888947.1 hypothetical protein N7495_008988 [Penicillium taxi]